MSYYGRLREFAEKRYDQEVVRGQQAGDQRTFYFGLLGGCVAALATVLDKHQIVHNRSWIDWAFWSFVLLACLGNLFTFIQLALATRPQIVGYWPLTKSMREYADQYFSYYATVGTENPDAKVIDDVDRVFVKRIEEVTELNHVKNNLRNSRTTRAFWGLVWTAPVVVVLFALTLLQSPVRAETCTRSINYDGSSPWCVKSTGGVATSPHD